MRTALAVLVVSLSWRGALADTPPAAPVNLVVSVPTIVAVSSTVDNRSILPEHLVDGKLDTAWNSRTNQLVGAWVGLRLPADVTVQTIKLTAGFTKKDRRLGDLFTLNPRIERVRVLRDGKTIAEKKLDPELRTLQSIDVTAAAGGDYRIEVTDIIPGTKKQWREIAISELEVWGLPGKTVVKKQKPIVRVGSFDPPPTLTKAECIKAMFPTAKGGRIGPDPEDYKIVGFDALALGGDIDICRVDHHSSYSDTTTAELAAVKRTPRLTVIQRVDTFTTSKEVTDYGGKEKSISLSAFPLTLTEKALLVEETDSEHGPMLEAGNTTHTLYRVTASAMTPILTFESKWSYGETGDGDRCTLQPPTLGAKLPRLEVECVVNHEGYPDPQVDDKSWSKTRIQKYRWTGSAYEK
jgi:hypothetical protein